MTLIDIQTEFREAEARVRRALADPVATQERLLQRILTVNRDTAIGRALDFATIDSLATYRGRVPLISASELAPWVDRMIAGEPDVLFEGQATFFGCTSGTTAAPKRVGFNPRVRDEYVHMIGVTLTHLERDFPGASRAALFLTAQFEESLTPTGIPMGNASGFVRRALDEHPFFRLVPEVVYECRDPEARSYTILLFALTRPMRCFASLFPVILENLFRRANEYAGALADDLERGRLAAGPPGIRALASHCAPRLRPRPEAARRLREIMRVHGKFVPHEYWPDVEALFVWKGGTAKHALPELQALFPRAQIRPLPSGSTEAALMVAFEASWGGGVPCLESTVMDFLPAEAPLDPREVVTLADLERDRGYRLVVTNHRGLYRYVMEDVFVVEGVYEGVPYLHLDHRLGIVSSMAGEKLTEEQVSHAIDRAIAVTRVALGAFQVAPQKLAGSAATYRYVVQAELKGAPSPAELEAFVTAFEDDLRRHNSQYSLNRNLGVLGPPVLRAVPDGHFEARLRARSKRTGRTDVQWKQVALSTEVLAEEEVRDG